MLVHEHCVMQDEHSQVSHQYHGREHEYESKRSQLSQYVQPWWWWCGLGPHVCRSHPYPLHGCGRRPPPPDGRPPPPWCLAPFIDELSGLHDCPLNETAELEEPDLACEPAARQHATAATVTEENFIWVLFVLGWVLGERFIYLHVRYGLFICTYGTEVGMQVIYPFLRAHS